MNKITTWIFHFSWVRILNRIKGLPYKAKMETEAIISRCTYEILGDVKSHWRKIRKLPYELDIKAIQNFCARWERKDHEHSILRSDPVFTTNEVAKLKLRFFYFAILVLIFPIAESFLFYLTASLFVPGANDGIKVGVSVFLALLILFGCGYGLDKHFKYQDACELYAKEKISKFQFRKYKHRLILGYVCLAFSILTILFSGLSRIFFLENIPNNDLPPEKRESIHKASSVASFVTFCVTVVTGILLAAVKQEQGKHNVNFLVYRSWNNANIRRNRLAKELIQNATEILTAVDVCIEKNWQLEIDLKRILLMDTEYDPLFESQYKIYMAEKAKPGFVINEDMYLKVQEIQGVYRDLFEYAVLRQPVIKEKVEFAKTIEKLPKAAIAAYLLSISSEADKTYSKPYALQNGKADNNIIYNLKNSMV